MKFHFPLHHNHHHHHHGGGGMVGSPTDHPSALIVIDVHGSRDCRTAEYGCREHHHLDAGRHHGECIHNHSRSSSPTTVTGHHRPSSACRHAETNCPNSPTDDMMICDGGDDLCSPMMEGSPTSKRALHLEHDESECPVMNPDPHSRPRSRQFFRLGRHRSRGIDRASASTKGGVVCGGLTSDSSDDELAQSEGGRQRSARRRSRGNFGLRKPLLRRAQSLPVISTTVVSSPTMAVAESSPSLAVAESIDPPNRGHRRHVTFTCVQIREYSTILGDHPCCPSGPPLSLGWNLERENSMEFETYEKERIPARVKCKDEMRLNEDVRRDILRNLVVTSPNTSMTGGNDDDHHSASDPEDGTATAATEGCCVYTRRELCRAERRLLRDRAGNSRAHNRRNRSFFRPLTPEECEMGCTGGSCDATVGVTAPTAGPEDVDDHGKEASSSQ